MHREDALSGLLQNWNPLVEPDATFNRAVWSRIKEDELRRSSVFSNLFFWVQFLAHPRIAIAATVIALLGGVLIGNFQSQSMQERLYLLSLNPYTQR